MSNFLAIATVTATLQAVLQSVIDFEANQPAGAAPPGRVTTLRLDAPDNALPNPGVNIFLYQATPNAAFRNVDLPSRNGDGTVVQRPRAALDLYYLLTFYGDDAVWESQRLMGIVVRALHGRPLLTRAGIRATVDPTAHPELRGSNLADEVEEVKLTPLSMSLDDLSKLWMIFPEIPYRLSTAYNASVVFIEGDEPSQGGLPVRHRNVYAVQFRPPVIERVVSVGGPDQPILAGSTLAIHGRGLQGDVTLVRLGDTVVAAPQAGDRQVVLSLPTLPAGAVRAGVQGLQVVHQVRIGSPEAPHEGAESNLVPLVVQPAIATDGAGNPLITLNVTASGGTRSGEIEVTVVPDVGKGQRVVLLLNELGAPTSRPPHAYTFEDPSRDVPSEPDRRPTVTVPVENVLPGTYLARVRVDGADSPLQPGPDGRYSRPVTVIP